MLEGRRWLAYCGSSLTAVHVMLLALSVGAAAQWMRVRHAVVPGVVTPPSGVGLKCRCVVDRCHHCGPIHCSAAHQSSEIATRAGVVARDRKNQHGPADPSALRCARRFRRARRAPYTDDSRRRCRTAGQVSHSRRILRSVRSVARSVWPCTETHPAAVSRCSAAMRRAPTIGVDQVSVQTACVAVRLDACAFGASRMLAR